MFLYYVDENRGGVVRFFRRHLKMNAKSEQWGIPLFWNKTYRCQKLSALTNMV